MQPGWFPALLFLGASRVELGQPAQAVEPLRQAVRLQPQDRNAQLYLAHALLDTEQPAEAAVRYRIVAAALPGAPAAWYGLGRACHMLAGQAFRKLSAAQPGSAFDLALAGDFELQRGQLARAFANYRKALAMEPGVPGVPQALADIYERTGHPDWAVRQRALPQPAPSATPADFQEARQYSAQARAAFDRLRGLPPSPERYQAEAQEFEREGKFREAAAAWRLAVDAAPGRASLRYSLARALYRAHDPGARGVLKSLLDGDPGSAEWNFLYGSALLESQEAEAALPFLERSVRAGQANPAAQAALGQALLEAGRPEAAVSHIETGAREDPDGTRHYQLARALRAAGQPEAAKAALARSTALREAFEQRAREPAITPP